MVLCKISSLKSLPWYVFVLVVFVFTCEINSVDSKSGTKVLSRRKRVVVFPEGASLSVALCSTVQMILPGQGVFTEAVNWGLNYNLPSNISEFKEFSDFLMRQTKHGARRNRRDVYQNLETIMYSMGYDGRTCIYRALCETTKKLVRNGDNIIKELFRVVFQFPLERLSPEEPEEHRLYHRASRLGAEKQNCSVSFPNCPFSLLDLALGVYSVPMSMQ